MFRPMAIASMRFLRAPTLAFVGLAAACGGDEPGMMDTDTGGTGSSTSTTTADLPDGLEADPDLDEEFDDDDALDAWEVLNPDASDVDVSGGALQLEPVANSLWFNGSAGVLLYRLIEGDFVVTAPVVATQTMTPGAAPDIQFRLGGLMARSPVEGAQNYVFVVVGADGDDISIETKTTRNSASEFDGPRWGDAAVAELRVCRRGSSFRLFAREGPAAEWTEYADFMRNDLPNVLQVGPMAYANDVNPNLRVTFDRVSFFKPDSAADCTRD